MNPAPETAVTSEPNDGRSPRKAVMSAAGWPLVFDLCLWMIRSLSAHHPFMVKWGIHPRSIDGLTGIITAPFIHADNDHLLSNTLPVLVVGTALVHFYRSISLRVVGMIWLFSGCWVWLMARDSYHIGASGLVYGGVVFLFFSGIFRRDVRLMAISFLVVFLYGSLAWGILPIDPTQSWESHLSGSIAGLFAAVYYRKEGPQRIRFEWEDEPLDAPELDFLNENGDETVEKDQNSTRITYHFVERKGTEKTD
jgi:membrane associated rhomboid family serine protease